MYTLNDEDVTLSVKYGATWMDEFLPGWAHNIDLSSLKMQNCENCIVGQAIRDMETNYWEIISNEAPGESHQWAIDNGFDVSREGLTDDEWLNESGTDISELAYGRYHQLESLWTNEVMSRVG